MSIDYVRYPIRQLLQPETLMTLDQLGNVPAWIIHLTVPLAILLRIVLYMRIIKAEPSASPMYLRSTFAFHVLLLVAIVAMLAVLVVDWRTALPADEHLSMTVALVASCGLNYWFLQRLLSSNKNIDI